MVTDARRSESNLDVYRDMEACFERSWSDGLPVVPPYGSLVSAMLEAIGWDATEVIGLIPAQSIEIRAEHLAAAAVMAGCKTDYGPVIRAVAEALVDPAFNVSGVEVTTGGVAALVIVSGPIVEELGFEYGSNALGANCRANATVGRFAQMARYFCGRGGGALGSYGTMGHPGRLSFCIAERPDRRWPSFHTQLGLPEDVSAVALMAAEGPNSVNNHYGDSPEAVLDTIADCLAHNGATNYYWHYGCSLVVIGPAHAELIAASYTREQARRYLFEAARRPTDDLRTLGRLPSEPRAKSKVEPGSMRSPFDHEEQIHLIECGADGGRFSAVSPGGSATTTSSPASSIHADLTSEEP